MLFWATICLLQRLRPCAVLVSTIERGVYVMSGGRSAALPCHALWHWLATWLHLSLSLSLAVWPLTHTAPLPPLPPSLCLSPSLSVFPEAISWSFSWRMRTAVVRRVCVCAGSVCWECVYSVIVCVCCDCACLRVCAWLCFACVRASFELRPLCRHCFG